MYSHRSEKDRVDVVDLDPYGSAAPFLDAAVQCIKDDGERLSFSLLYHISMLYYFRLAVRHVHRYVCPR